jgi:hypothetical protein
MKHNKLLSKLIKKHHLPTFFYYFINITDVKDKGRPIPQLYHCTYPVK